MKNSLRCLLPFVFLVSSIGHTDEPQPRDLYPDTWVATDALGRTMPDVLDVGPVKQDQKRVVGIFYMAWHRDRRAKMKSPYAADVTKVLSGDPAARLDAKHPLWTRGAHHWGEPEAGYFLSKDEYVIRQDMSMLADAGVDVLVMDVTNAVRQIPELTGLAQITVDGDFSDWGSVQVEFRDTVGDTFHRDNPSDLKGPISLCINGDSAPNRRFNYRCIWKK